MKGPAKHLGPLLDSLARRYDRRFIDSDPLLWPRRYDDPRDKEVVAVIAALLAYGRVASINGSIQAVLAALPARPSTALSRSRRPALSSRLAGFRHRFTSGEDLAWVLESVGAAWDSHGSLGNLVASAAKGAEPLRAGLAAWHALATSIPASAAPARARARKFLLPDPMAGGACKRILLLSRWCVRPDDGLDLGIWSGGRLAPRDLMVPLDTHVHRIARHLRMTRRSTPDWKTVREVTDHLKTFDPEDPVRFDFALARPGILGLCLHRYVPPVCGACDLLSACSIGSGKRNAMAGPPDGRATRRSRSPSRAP